MKGISHIIAGIVSVILVYNVLNIKIDMGIVLSACIGSLFPDIDSKNSYISKKIRLLLILISISSVVLIACIKLGIIKWLFGSNVININAERILFGIVWVSIIIYLFISVLKHRGAMHKLGTGILISTILSLMLYSLLNINGIIIGIAFSIGYISHILSDRIL